MRNIPGLSVTCSDDIEMLGHEFVEAMDFIKTEVLDNLQEQSVQKGTKYFVKQVRKCVRGNVQKLVQTMYSVRRQAAAPLRSGRKRNSKDIPVQPHSQSRRVSKHLGHGKALGGNPKTKDREYNL